MAVTLSASLLPQTRPPADSDCVRIKAFRERVDDVCFGAKKGYPESPVDFCFVPTGHWLIQSPRRGAKRVMVGQSPRLPLRTQT